MPMSDADRRDAMVKLTRKMFDEMGNAATLSTDDVKAAVDQVDSDLELSANQFAPTVSLEGNLNQRLPEPFKGTATLAQKGLLLAYVAMKKYGVI